MQADTQTQSGTDVHTEVNERIQTALKGVGDAADAWNIGGADTQAQLQALAEAGARLSEAARTAIELTSPFTGPNEG